jgi:chromosome partitioning protein
MYKIIVHSYKGGAGKTLISTNIANLLVNKFNKKVLLIEADFTMPVFTELYPDYKPDLFINDYFNDERYQMKEIIYRDYNEQLGLIFASPEFSPNDKVFTADLEFHKNTLDRLESDFSKLEYDYIIVDQQPGKNLFLINWVVISDAILLLMRPDKFSLKGILNLINQFYSSGALLQNKKISVIFNQIPKHEKIEILLDSWKELLSRTTNVNLDFYDIYYSDFTAYHLAIENIQLPDNDPTLRSMLEFIHKNFKI